ncbi:hypothetical protein BPC006_II2227 [Burkholderia pseudomallei BPC006]|uniref:Uncharacterized protein n=4 Tax=pseudomallei group TaxID=111527 RepID=Q3JKM1_BURP1|nr:Hypothetical protein BURPS1710b_A0723 [Burkholderia pseudomallei 1710b]AFR20153.1 hypothetical protein BPC006_II2227 [Burkholderia pseudomallei BPC006]
MLGASGVGERGFRRDADVRVQMHIELRDASKHCLRQFHWRQVSLSQLRRYIACRTGAY